jgi:hypothetical protein
MSEDDKDIKIGDILKRVVNTGVSAAFMTEEAVRKNLKDLPLPKDAVNNLLKNAKSTKEEFIQSVKNELKSYLDDIDLSKEIDRVLENYDFDIQAKISAKKKKSGKS